MTPEEYNWDTWFITHQDIMSHKLTPRVEVRSNIKTGLICVFRDDKEIYKIDGSKMLKEEYEQFLIKTAKEALLLPNINQ